MSRISCLSIAAMLLSLFSLGCGTSEVAPDGGLAADACSAVEVCGDGIDQNCDGMDVPCDLDGDGFPADSEVGGAPDCDDTDPLVHPDVVGQPTVEVCTAGGGTPRDENCNLLVDELSECVSDDRDADGAEDCARTGGAPGCDCNDCDPTIGPREREICGNGIDEDCDSMRMDIPCNPSDADSDGELAASAGGTDCNDADPRVGMDALERCDNGIDDDCDGTADACRTDTDGDQYAEPPHCEGNAAIVPYTEEVCNGIDDNCDGRVDEPNRTSAAPYDACVLPRAGEAGCTGGRCAVQYASSFFHCGGCGMACDFLATDVCAGGSCQCTNGAGLDPACVAGTTCCAGQGCHDLQTDLRACGNCATDCEALYGARIDACAAGACSCGGSGICADGETCCAGECVDLRSDPTHCGSCGNVCTLPFATATCDLGACVVASCASLRADCDGAGGNGCEIDVTTPSDCGACGVSCAPGESCLIGSGPTATCVSA